MTGHWDEGRAVGQEGGEGRGGGEEGVMDSRYIPGVPRSPRTPDPGPKHVTRRCLYSRLMIWFREQSLRRQCVFSVLAHCLQSQVGRAGGRGAWAQSAVLQVGKRY